MMNYKLGDVVSTTKGFLTVMCPFVFNNNDNAKYKALGGRTLYWMQDMDQEDVFFWDHDLEKLLTEEEKQILLDEEPNELF